MNSTDGKNHHASMSPKQKSNPTLKAVIREDECIGCVKCIRACPTDAILGAPKLMHTVITDACTGCELCVEPCPMDCIDMKTIPKPSDPEIEINEQRWEIRRQKHLARLAQQKEQAIEFEQQTLAARKAAISAAVNRSKAKRNQHESKKT